MNNAEIQFLEGPQSRLKELKFIFQTALELIRGFRALHFVGPCITVFGSARFKEDHPYYDLTRKAAAEVAQLGFTIMTGGGPEHSTMTLEYFIYNHLYTWQHVGYAASIAWFVFVIVFLVTIINWRFGGKLVQYSNY